MFFKRFMPKKQLSTRALPGILELLPQDQIAFDKMKQSIQNIFESFGFIPLDTSVLEREEILLAKSGGDTEKEIYRIKKGDNDLALRFDLTIPFARYVSEHSRDLVFPFRKYQIGRVYRGERAQRGRYRDFYQCDIDIIGDGELSLKNDAEIPSVIYTIFSKLNVGPFEIRLSNRKILSGLLEEMNLSEKRTYVLRIVDKLQKIGRDKVTELLEKEKLNKDQIDKILKLATISGINSQVLIDLKNMSIENETFKTGVDELSQVVKYATDFGVPSDYLKVDLSIVRGLDYYTGTVYETFLVDDRELGSVCSGGRYDSLVSSYSDRKLPGVGVGIGLTRLFTMFREKGLISHSVKTLSQVLVAPLVSGVENASEIANYLRSRGIRVEVFLEESPLKKKMNYANRQGIPFVILIGEDEIKNDRYTLKNMATGDQQTLSITEVYKVLSANQ